MRRWTIAVGLSLVVVSLTACSASTPSSSSQHVPNGKIICPTTDSYSCYYSGTNVPVHDARSLSYNNRMIPIVGTLSATCAAKRSSCLRVGSVGVAANCNPSPCTGVTNGNYSVWRVGASKRLVAIYEGENI
jgi:hypothetical protein